MKKKLLAIIWCLALNTVMFSQVTIGSGTAVDANTGLCTPISNWYAYSLSQTIFLASELNATGTITSLEFPLNNANGITNSDDMINVWIGHTTKTQFNPTNGATGADLVDVATLTQVMTNATIVNTGSNTTYTLSTPFTYNGSDNLVIVVGANEPGDDGPSTLYYQSPTTNIMTMMIRSDSAPFNATNPTLNYTGSSSTDSWQGKTTRAITTLNGLTLGLEDVELSKGVMYPNPTDGILNFEGYTDAISKVEIYDVLGKRVYTNADLGTVTQIDISNLQGGIYLVKAYTINNVVSTKKVIKN